MTDKQIIIDECNVGECKYFSGYQRIVRNNECIVDMQNACIEEIETKPCRQKHNCYFKNWQRKEQECEELKAENNTYKSSIIANLDNNISKRYRELLEENDQLKKENEELKIYIESNEQQVKEVETLVMDNDRLINELDQLKEQITYQRNFIDSLLLATNNSEWLEKSILDDEASEIIEKIEMDYVEFEEGKEINAELKAELEQEKAWHKTSDEISKVNSEYTAKLKQTFAEIKEIAEDTKDKFYDAIHTGGLYDRLEQIIRKINEVEE